MVPVLLAPPPCAYAGADTAIAIAASREPINQRFILFLHVGTTSWTEIPQRQTFNQQNDRDPKDTR
jgi:hypothetical protein